MSINLDDINSCLSVIQEENVCFTWTHQTWRGQVTLATHLGDDRKNITLQVGEKNWMELLRQVLKQFLL